MKHIEKITISNARRFGKNIEIKFGPGATIIIAPNGTGKTTVFEAIELALTGSIERIKENPEAIIRNGQSQIDVRLDFTGSKYREVSYNKNGLLQRNGNCDDLYEIDDSTSLPYLYRLTHYLEQRGRGWFVEKDDKDAGDLLSKLPIGKELQNIISKKTSLLRAITSIENSHSNEYEQALKELYDFEELISKRDRFAKNASLMPLDQLTANLVQIAALCNCEGYSGDLNTTRVSEYFETVKVSLKQESDKKNELLIKLSSLDERVERYNIGSEIIANNEVLLVEQRKRLEDVKSVLEIKNKQVQNYKHALVNIQKETRILNSKKVLFEQLKEVQKVIREKELRIESITDILDKTKTLYYSQIQYLDTNQRLRDQHKLVNDKIGNETSLLHQIEVKKFNIELWNKLSESNEEIINIRIPDLIERIELIKDNKNRIDNSLSKAENEYSKKSSILESLRRTTDAVQNAVSTIRSHLVENQDYCPVCKAEYNPNELIRRIEESLTGLDPSIPIMIEEKKNALKTLEDARNEQTKLDQILINIQLELESENNELMSNYETINNKFLSIFPGCSTVTEATSSLEMQITHITDNINALKEKKSNLKPEVSMEEIEIATLDKSTNERLIKDLTSSLNNLRGEIEIDTLSINKIKGLLENENEYELSKLISIRTIEEEEKEKLAKTMEESLSEKERVTKAIENTIFNKTEEISKNRGNLQGIQMEWYQANLNGIPDKEKLNKEYEQINSIVHTLAKASISLFDIEKELTIWYNSDNFFEIDSEIKTLRRNESELSYLGSLEKNVEHRNIKLQRVKEKKNTIIMFLATVAFESEQVQDQLNSINEPWKRLLKRIVINPLISTAPLLKNTLTRNTPKAKISANIHNHDITISSIASEAQLTDLQLTLMLSLANKYKWTPWKALLLDDPTQHHDLVHASSVFDVLRDYIIEFDYQVLMSTHDSSQARFLQRKLENEGVKAKIYRLVAREGGVTAELVL